MSDDYYKILGLQNGANPDEIKSAYKKLARKYHPDNKETGDTKKFQEITKAYSILSDSGKKNTYDSGGRNEHFSHGFDGSDFFSGFDDIFKFFKDDFGFSDHKQKRKQKGSDLRLELHLTLEDIVNGTSKNVKFNRLGRCSNCHGYGAQNEKLYTCSICNGSGEIKKVSKSFFGNYVSISICNHCKGVGKIIIDKCSVCRGLGKVNESVSVNVKIPLGVKDQDKLRVVGYGEAGKMDGDYGDLYIYIHIQPHQLFTKDGNNILYNMKISFLTAVIGGEVKIPTLKGMVKKNILPGTQSGHLIRLNGYGLNNGDHIVSLFIDVPKNLNQEQIQQLKELFNSFKS